MKFLRLNSLVICLAFVVAGKAQSPEESLENVRLNYSSEKIFIQYDKESYVAGETIWFKVYFLSGFLPSVFSSTVSVELLNDSGRVIEKKILPIVNSTSAGNFDVPTDAAQMNYTVRAYTNRLRNFGVNNFYFHQIPVYNPSTAKEIVVPERQLTLYFLPESGNFINGIKNVVAFKCMDQWGYPADASGIISDVAGKTVASFKTEHDGMGKFEMVPMSGEKYIAISTLEKTINKNFALPVSINSGALLSVQKLADKTYFFVNTETIADENMQATYLLAVMENTVVFKIPLPPDQKNFKGTIPVSDIPSGILQLTLFNKKDQPLAERLMFIRNKDYVLDGKFNTDTFSLASRAKNVYTFELQDTLDGSYSVSVTDVNKELKQVPTDHIISRFLVTNDLRGYIYNPTYYFEADDEEHRNNIDLLMLTNGWRKFTWNEILSSRLPPMLFKDPNYISLTGIAYNDGTDKTIGEASLSVYVKTKTAGSNLMVVQTNKTGAFEIPGLIFSDTATLYFQNLSAKNRRISTRISSESISSSMKIPVTNLLQIIKPLSTYNADKIKNIYSKVLENDNNKVILLSDVKVVAKSKNPTKLLEERYIRNGLFNTYAAKTIDLVNDPAGANNTTNVFEYIKGRVAGIAVSGTTGSYTLNYRNSLSLRSGLIPMDIFLDEIQVSNTQEVASIPMTQIAMIKVFSTGFIGSAGNGPGGALAIYTKKGDDALDVPGLDNLFRLTVAGYSPVKEFFSPDYSIRRDNIQTPDYRTTLYWDPNLETNQSGKKVSFSFYNTEQTKKIKVIFQGMTSDGKFIYIEKVLE